VQSEPETLVEALLRGMGGPAQLPGSALAAHMPTLFMLAYHGSFGKVVELGVGRGWSTVALLAGVVAGGRSLTSYDHSSTYGGCLIHNLRLSDRHPLLGSWDFRVKDSIQAASDFSDGSVSLLFVDTVHTLDHTRAELAAWEPKIHPDGILSGHDYLLDRYGDVTYGVKEAVDEFAELHSDRFQLQVLPHDCGLFILRPQRRRGVKT
jgi:predicted O-methyltransferase YrrM